MNSKLLTAKNVRILLLSTIFSIIPYTSFCAINENPSEAIASLKQQMECDTHCNAYREILEQVDMLLEHAALIINNNQVRGLNKKEAIPLIFQLRQFIRPYKENRIATPTPEYTLYLAKIVDAVVAYVEDAVKNNFSNLTAFDPEALTIRKPLDPEQNLEGLKEHITRYKINVASLEYKVQTIGLNILNRTVRRIEKFNSDYNVAYWTAVTAGITAAGVFLVWRLDPPLQKWYESTKANTCAFGSFLYKKTTDAVINLKSFMGITASPTIPDATDSGSDTNDSDDTVPAEKFLPNISHAISTPSGDLQKLIAMRKELMAAAFSAAEEGDLALATELLEKAQPLTREINFLENTPSLNEPNNKTVAKLCNAINDFGTKTGIFSILPPAGFVWYALHEQFKKPVEEKVKQAWQSTVAFYNMAMSYLRGGPVKKVMGHIYEREPKATFDDIICNDSAKEKLLPVIDYLNNPEPYDRAGVDLNKIFLLVGPPRTGKSFFAEAVAGEILRMSKNKVHYYSLGAAQLKMFSIKGLFIYLQDISQKETVVLLIDEIDTGGFIRQGATADTNALCELLTALSELNRDKKCRMVILACTNKPENLDQALLEAGRFGTHIYFNYPTNQERKQFLARELRNRTIEIEASFIEYIASLTENCSFDILNILLATALQRAKLRGTSLSKEDILMAYYQEVNKIIFDDLSLPQEEQHIIAIHQAAQVLCRHELKTKRQVALATTYAVNPDIARDALDSNGHAHNLKKNKMRYGQVFTINNQNTLSGELAGDNTTIGMPKFFTSRDYILEIKALVAGQVAENIINGCTGYIYCKNEQEEALDLAKFVCLQGLVEQNLPTAFKDAKLQEALQLVELCKKEVETLLRAHLEQLLELANALHESKILSAGQMNEIIKNTAPAPVVQEQTPQ